MVERRASTHQLGRLEQPEWASAPARPRVRTDAVQVWRVDLGGDAGPDAALLSTDELSRAARYRLPRDRERFARSRGTLRRILGRYLDLPPHALRFTYSAQGKPALAAPWSSAGLHFNLAHAGDLMLLAVGAVPLGIDVEALRELAFLEIAETLFAAEEYAELVALPRGRQMDAFFACWTRKEAWLKACGEGLSRPLDSFVVPVGDGGGLREVRGKPREAELWTLVSLALRPGYAAALAVRARGIQLECWSYQGE